MRKTMSRETNNHLAVSADTLAAMLDCGRPTAIKIGVEAGAKIQVGRRTLYRVSIIERYLDNMVVGDQ